MDEAGTRRLEKDRIDGARFLAEHHVTVVVVEGAAAGVEVVVDRDELVVGRNPGADLSLPDDALSGVHAAIELGLSGFRVRDLGSTNGTFVNGSQVQATDLKDGDRITVGEHTLQYRQQARDDADASAGSSA
jgi:pSer/pThr/pTyr-binding forkhead associated (FHA) protein